MLESLFNKFADCRISVKKVVFLLLRAPPGGPLKMIKLFIISVKNILRLIFTSNILECTFREQKFRVI